MPAVPALAAAEVAAPIAVSEVPQLSEELRRQVRARLEAEAAKLVSQRPQPAPIPSSAPKKVPSAPKATPKKEPLKLDLERDHARTKKELADTLERFGKLDHYEVLGVSRRASIEEINGAHQKLARTHHPDRVVPGTSSRELRSLSERVLLLIERAYETLSFEPSRRAYDRAIGVEDGDARIAPLVIAERAFVAGKEALEKGEHERARALFLEATEKNPSEGTYFAHLGLATFSNAPKDESARSAAFEALDRALELSPLVEEVYLFRGTIQQKVGNRIEAVREFERALRCNPDSVLALEALRTLEPPAQRKTSFLSRLTS
jgi:tetratricopeptide (TPR) repeat protein